MADNTFGAILSGDDPTAQAQAQAYERQRIAEQQLNDTSNQGIFGGLANVLAGANMRGVPQMVGDIAQQKIAAQPDLARLLAADDPWKEAAANPNANPIALQHILAGGPAAVAAARNQMADAAYRQALGQFQLFRIQGMAGAPPIAPGAAGTPSGAPAGGGAPGGALPPPGSLGGGHYPASTAAAGGLGGGDVLDPAQVPAAQMPAYVQRLNPSQRAMFLAKLRMRTVLPPQAAAAPGPAAGTP